MYLELDFEQRLVLAVFNEIGQRSTSEPGKPEEIITASPVTQYHFGGTCYYSKFHKRFAWARPYTVQQDGRTITQNDRLVISFGHYNPPEEWRNEKHQNHMKHSHVSEIVDAANQIIGFVLDGTLPEVLYPGDYHYREPLLKA
jgi:hypothetical protein